MIGKEKLNKKGFTLVEVLAVIVILGILSTIGTVSIINLRKKQEEKFNNTQLQIFKQTSQTYFSDNKSKLPTTPSGTETIYLKDLIDNNYIDELLDYRKNEYDRDKSYVKVTRVGVDAEYAYTPVLYKDGDDEPPIEEKLENNSEIKFTDYTKTATQNTDEIQKLGCLVGSEKSFDCSGENISKYYSNYTTKVSVTAENPNDGGIKYYRYEILKNKKVVSSSEYIIPKNLDGTMSDTITLNHDDYSDGEYKVRIVVYDKNATPKAENSIPIVLDYTKPVCKPKKTPSTPWANKKDIETEKSVKVEGVCRDDGSGCVDLDTVKGVTKSSLVSRYSEYKEEMQKTVEVGKAYDYAGNIADCGTVDVNIDTTDPVCTSSGGSNTWTNQNMVIKGTCTDTNGSVNSGCKQAEITKTISSENNKGISPGTVYDIAGNSANCSNQTVKIDKTKPVCTSTGGSDAWTAGNRNLVGTCSDTKGSANSGCVQATVSKTVNYSNNSYVSPGTVRDNAGNVTDCPGQIARVDHDAPACYPSGGVSTWQLNSQTIYGQCDDHNGSGCTGNVYTTFAYTVAGTFSPGAVCDSVGHCTPCGEQTVYVDADNPSISCAVSDCGTSGCSVTVSASDTSGISSGTGVATNIKASRSFTVNDGVGHASSCSVSISAYTQTKHRTRSYIASCTKYKNGTCYKYESHGEPYCSKTLGGSQVGASNCPKSWSNCCQIPYSCQKAYTATSPNCGTTDWGSWSSWSTSSCKETTLKDCKSRTNYKSP